MNHSKLCEIYGRNLDQDAEDGAERPALGEPAGEQRQLRERPVDRDLRAAVSRAALWLTVTQ